MSKKVFINCPYDIDYKLFQFRLVFVLLWFDYDPILSSDSQNKTSSRFEKIKQEILNSDISIHDLSRSVCAFKQDKKKPEYYRHNMPLELGYALACADLDINKNKKILILGKNRSEIEIAASDIVSFDVAFYHNESYQFVKAIRDFLIEVSGDVELENAELLESFFIDFYENLDEKNQISSLEFKKKSQKYILKQKTI